MSPFVRFGNALGAGGMALILAIGFGLQFLQHELPCPICNLQRAGFALCGFGFILNLRFGAHPSHYGLILLSALFGIAASGRQVLLHLFPGSGAYGAPVLGLHLYTWSLILFLAVIGGTALLMMLSGAGRMEHSRSDAQAAARYAGFSRLMASVLIVMTFANALAAFVQCGPVECPANPTSYWLMHHLPFIR